MEANDNKSRIESKKKDRQYQIVIKEKGMYAWEKEGAEVNSADAGI